MFLFVYIIYLMYICELIKSKFMDYKNYIQYHNAKAIDKNGLIGVCRLWGYKNIFKFGNEKFETIGWIEYPLTAFETGDLIQITNDEFYKEFEKRNVYSDETDRTKRYGVIHDSFLKIGLERTNQPYWSRDFCVAFATTYANMKIMEECKSRFNTIDKNEILSKYIIDFRELYLKHHISFDRCTYTDKLEEIDNGNISIEDVLLQIEEFKKIPIEWYSEIESEMDDFLK